MSACPKCGASDDAETRGACGRCGLRTDLWPGFDPSPSPNEPLDAAFARLRKQWSDPAAHDEFLRLAHSLAVLDGAAARYRQVERERVAAKLPADPQLARALAQVAVFVTQLERAAPRDDLRSFRTLYYVAIVLAAILCTGAAYFVWRTFAR